MSDRTIIAPFSHAPARVAALVLVVFTTMLMFPSCSDGVVTFTGGVATVRIFNAQTKAMGMNVEIDSVRRFVDLAPGRMTEFTQVSSGVFHVFTGQSSTDSGIGGRIVNQRYMLGDGAAYTMVVRGSTITDFIKPVLDSAVSPFASKAAVRIINATDTTYCDVYANGTKINGIVAEVQSAGRLFPVEAGRVVFETRDVYKGTIVSRDTLDIQAGHAYHLFVFDKREGSSVVRKVTIISLH
ncbi:MAG: DUF4397 domain-containing protein [Candidatus Kapaibacterium sp.]